MLHNESKVVSATNSEDVRQLCRSLVPHVHFFRAPLQCCSTYTGQSVLHNEATIVSAPDLEDVRHLCRFLTPLSLTRVLTYTY